jgi:hypothetical protein
MDGLLVLEMELDLVWHSEQE